MKTLVIYDEEGKVIFTNTNEKFKYGEINPIIISVPEGKYVKSMTMNEGQYYPVFEDIPISQYEDLENKLEEAIVELSMMIAMGGTQ